MTGVTISRYLLVQKLGEGGMGEVYLARDRELGRNVALKRIVHTSEDEGRSRRRFLREAKLAASINHPFVCKVYEAGEDPHGVFIAMEFIEGRTLAAQLREAPLPLDQVLRIFTEVAEAVRCAHESGLVHRDLKPSNIMLAADGHIRVLDFGIAKQLRATRDETEFASTLTGQVSGTLAYMSPEQISGQRIDHRSDIFSLGLVFFEMFTKVHPFYRNSAMATAMAILHEEPPPLNRFESGVPVELDATIKRMLAKSTIHRFQSVQQVLDALRLAFRPETFSVPKSRPGPTALSIAVMPFINMSSDPSQEFFSDGVTEDLIRQLSRLPGTKVLARTSIMRYKNSDKPVPEIGSELGVAYILEGSVRQSANKVRISSGLVEVATGTYVWSEVYDRDLTDILAIQSDVATQIATSLQMTLTIGERFRVTSSAPNVESYQSFLKGMYLLNRLVPDSIEKSIRFFQEALTADPSNARAHAGISYANCMLGHFDYLPSHQAFSSAKDAALRALDLGPRLAETHICMGLTQMFYDWDWGAAENSFRQALKINSNSADAHLYYSWCLALMQEVDRAVTEARHALDLDPLSPTAQTNLAQWLINCGKFEEGINILSKALDLNPLYLSAYTVLGHAYVGLGDYDRAMSSFEKFTWRRTLQAIALAVFGKKDEALAIVDTALNSDTERWRPSEIGLLHIMTGHRENAEEWLDRALEERDYMIGFYMACEWAPYYDDPLLVNHLKQMGIVRRTRSTLTVASN